MAKERNRVGRPTVMTPDVIAKLEQVFAIDGTVEEAISYAEIGANSFYDYLKINPEFSKRIADLRQRPVLKARQTIVKALEQDPNLAMRYLEKKKKKEFGLSLDVTTQGEAIKAINYIIPLIPKQDVGNNIEANTETTPSLPSTGEPGS